MAIRSNLIRVEEESAVAVTVVHVMVFKYDKVTSLEESACF